MKIINSKSIALFLVPLIKNDNNKNTWSRRQQIRQVWELFYEYNAVVYARLKEGCYCIAYQHSYHHRHDMRDLSGHLEYDHANGYRVGHSTGKSRGSDRRVSTCCAENHHLHYYWSNTRIFSSFVFYYLEWLVASVNTLWLIEVWIYLKIIYLLLFGFEKKFLPTEATTVI